MKKRNTLQFFRDRHGRVVVWQVPNVPLIGWLLCFVAGMFLPAGHLRAGVSMLSSAFLFTWAFLEITSGTSYFRRTLGIVVIVVVLAGFFTI